MTSAPKEMPAMIAPSAWVERHLSQLAPGARVLDLACGAGRHARLLAGRGFSVVAVDRDDAALAGLSACPGVETRQMDLEGATWPLAGERFGGVVVTNYLWRPYLDDVLALLAPGGVLIYETFMIGNERFGKPSNPDFLLRPDELRTIAARAGLREIAFEQGETALPKPAMRQAICAVRD